MLPMKTQRFADFFVKTLGLSSLPGWNPKGKLTLEQPEDGKLELVSLDLSIYLRDSKVQRPE